jgi:hypothetical protein
MWVTREAYKPRRVCGLWGKHKSHDVYVGYGGSIKATKCMWVTGGSIQATTYMWVTGEAFKRRRVCGLRGKHSSDDVYVGYGGSI